MDGSAILGAARRILAGEKPWRNAAAADIVGALSRADCSYLLAEL